MLKRPKARVYQLWWQPYGQRTSSSSSVATVYQLQQLFHLARNQASTWRVGEFKFITPAGSEEIALWSLSPKEGVHKAFMGWFFWVRAWRTRVRTGKVTDAGASFTEADVSGSGG